MDKKELYKEIRRVVRNLRPYDTLSAARAMAQGALERHKALTPTTGKGTYTSTGSVDHTIATIDVADEQAGLIWVMCFGVNTDGDTYAAIKQAQFKNTGGTVTIGTVTDTMSEEISATGATLEFDPDSAADCFYLNVNGNGIDMNWEVSYTVIVLDIPEAVIP